MPTDEKLVADDLLAILRCPRCRGSLSMGKAALGCQSCGLSYGVEGGVPNFLLEDAQPLPAGKGRV